MLQRPRVRVRRRRQRIDHPAWDAVVAVESRRYDVLVHVEYDVHVVVAHAQSGVADHPDVGVVEAIALRLRAGPHCAESHHVEAPLAVQSQPRCVQRRRRVPRRALVDGVDAVEQTRAAVRVPQRAVSRRYPRDGRRTRKMATETSATAWQSPRSSARQENGDQLPNSAIHRTLHRYVLLRSHGSANRDTRNSMNATRASVECDTAALTLSVYRLRPTATACIFSPFTCQILVRHVMYYTNPNPD